MKRRRFIRIMATGVAGLSLGRLAAKVPSGLQEFGWQGYLMGAEGSFRLYGDNPVRADAVIERCFQEIRRLERIFSLYDSHSTLTQLNRDARLAQPPTELLNVLQVADRVHAETEGGFDPTIQPLWRLYADHFAANPRCLTGPTAAAIEQCQQRIGLGHVEHSDREIRFNRPGMALTLNGAAQGYITDHVADILREAGFTNVIVELGETRALGTKPNGMPWRIGVLDAQQRDRLWEVVELQDRALATSGGYGSAFDESGKFHHLIDPRNGRPAAHSQSVSVVAPSALRADALSTGFSVMPAQTVLASAARNPQIEVIVQS